MWRRFLIVPALAAAGWGCANSSTPAFLPADSLLSPARPGNVIVRDDFDDPAAGRLPKRATVPDVEQGYLDGEYVLRLSPTATDPIYATGPDTVFANAHVEVDTRLVTGTETHWVGIACRVTVGEDSAMGAYVLALVPATGSFSMVRLEPGRMVRLVPDQFSKAVRRGDAVNHIELTCIGSNIIASINGTEVASVRDDTHDKGYAGIVVSRSAAIVLEARFDNLVITER